MKTHASLACKQRPTIDSEMESTLAGELSDSIGKGGALSPSTPMGSRSPTRSSETQKGRMVDWHGRGELDQVVIHAHAEEV
jgi:hypothetical protein